MNFTDYISADDLFHAYVIEGDKDLLADLDLFLSESLSLNTKSNPDIFFKSYNSFGIDDSREISRLAQMRPLGDRKCIAMATTNITTEAQDALLKIFEEPPERTHFFLIVQSKNLIRPTLLSRVQTISIFKQSDDIDLAEGFLAKSYAKRIKYVAKLAKEKDKATVISLLNNLEKYFSNLDLNNADTHKSLEMILLVKKYINDRGAMMKMLLESLAIELPMIEK